MEKAGLDGCRNDVASPGISCLLLEVLRLALPAVDKFRCCADAWPQSGHAVTAGTRSILLRIFVFFVPRARGRPAGVGVGRGRPAGVGRPAGPGRAGPGHMDIHIL